MSVQKKPINQQDIVTFQIKIPRYYYNLFSQFAQFLHSQPELDRNGQPVVDAQGKPQMALKSGDIQTYFVTCAYQTYEGYQMVMNMQKQQMLQQQQQQATQK